MSRVNNRKPSAGSLYKSFGYALRGLGRVIVSERNMKIHTAVAACVLALAAWLRLPAEDWPPLLICIGMVMGLEAMNSAVERAVDLASPGRHELAGWAKDAAAGAVLIAAVAAAGVGLLILGPPLWSRLFG
ncbi:diacylglycerol kinase family protein [Paenibacillus thermoaerophilus]|uniref:Diacylglycerol kinase family protein n=1 Tax=Paenibacillus thermoaerophilus TaxID=1215385 RepID=A0ABW2V0W7_9BACL|nr:diacylglycerol kinase family protein [Paenibacillus thermoaerophilus]TMV19028.1 diacylglycerol kinase family protein [Paenibacillus thermoaerophilus]